MGSLHPAAAAPLDGVVTPRLSLQPLSSDDLGELAAIFADREVWRFEYERGLTYVETEAFLDRQLSLWAEYGFGGCGVREVHRPNLVGVVGLSVPTVLQHLLPAVTVGWRFSSTIWGRGYATEAATAVLDQAFTPMALERVGCVTGAENHRSISLAERLGMSWTADASVQRDDGSCMVAVSLFQIARHDWLNTTGHTT